MYLTLTEIGLIHAQLQTIDVTIGEVENPYVSAPVYVHKVEEANDASVHHLKLKGLFRMKHGVRYQLSITISPMGSSWKDNLLTFCVCEGKLFWYWVANSWDWDANDYPFSCYLHAKKNNNTMSQNVSLIYKRSQLAQKYAYRTVVVKGHAFCATFRFQSFGAVSFQTRLQLKGGLKRQHPPFEKPDIGKQFCTYTDLTAQWGNIMKCWFFSGINYIEMRKAYCIQMWKSVENVVQQTQIVKDYRQIRLGLTWYW